MSASLYRRLLDVVMRLFLAAALPLLQRILPADLPQAQKMAILTVSLLPEIRAARRRAWIVAGQMIASEAKAVTGSVGSVAAMRGYADEALTTVLDNAISGNLSAAQVAATLVRHVEAAARDTFEDSLDHDPFLTDPDEITRDDITPFDDLHVDPPADLVEAITDEEHWTAEDFQPAIFSGWTGYDRWKDAQPHEFPGTEPRPYERGKKAPKRTRVVAYARMLTGADNCAFCVMLASRGPVYKSAKTAGQIPASLKFVDAEGWLNAYHDHCDCIVVPVYTSKDWPGKQQAEDLYDVWKTATDGYFQRDALNALRRHLTQLQNDGKQLVPDLRIAA